MKSIVIHAAKDLRIEETDPGTPGAGQVEISVEAGGICGSDLHYYNHGGFGVVRLREPMILGHEVAGTVRALGTGVSSLAVGDRVAISPSRPCNACRYCLQGMQNQCLNMRFYGSAMPMPHIQGAFRQRLVAEAWQCHKIADHVSINEAAFAEPFAVTLHAVNRAGPLLGKREAREIGADRTINVATDGASLAAYNVEKGSFDVMFECSGNERAVRAGLDVLKPRGVLVQLGLGGDMSLPQNLIVAKEIEMRGSFRFHDEFALAVDLINNRRVDVKPLLTGIYPMDEAVAAFEIAGDRTQSMKVQIAFA